ncbi:hypothetical protein PoB_007100700 [Plakobranchus ocellatus]|uniref:Uncharacterized protein n=1 Tax=Plakobranchus ocellatus TaxID=259542 RepID=A0AAV4DJN9_9GAST|nr:hypothetical protein PoB_007100700 [Plakobranchus ocellatus]
MDALWVEVRGLGTPPLLHHYSTTPDGPPSSQDSGDGARTRYRKIPADLKAESQATVPPTTPISDRKKACWCVGTRSPMKYVTVHGGFRRGKRPKKVRLVVIIINIHNHSSEAIKLIQDWTCRQTALESTQVPRGHQSTSP